MKDKQTQTKRVIHRSKDLPAVTVTLPREVLDKIDLIAGVEDRSRSKVLSRLLAEAIETRERKTKTKTKKSV